MEMKLFPWVTGVVAGTAVNKSATNKTYDGEYSIDTNYSLVVLHNVIPQADPPAFIVGNLANVFLAEQNGNIIGDLIQNPDREPPSISLPPIRPMTANIPLIPITVKPNWKTVSRKVPSCSIWWITSSRIRLQKAAYRPLIMGSVDIHPMALKL